jgi:hypothetical protein
MTIDLSDFRNMTTIEAITFFKARKDDSLGPLIRWIAEAEAFRRLSQEVRIAIANGEGLVESLTGVLRLPPSWLRDDNGPEVVGGAHQSSDR